MSQDSVIVERPAEGIGALALNRPEKRNALDLEVRHRLMDGLTELLEDPTVRAIVLYGKEGVFCAGGDISTMNDMSPEAARARMKSGHRFVRMLYDAEKPVVAAVEGFAVGAGLALLSDAIVMGEGATIGFPFFRLGLVPDWGILYTLPRRVGVGRAKQILLQARMVKGAEAETLGMADLLVPDDAVLEEALGLAGRLASQPAHAFSLVKRQLHLMPASFDEALEMETMVQSLGFQTSDFAEGRAAFMEKRKPRFG